MGGMVTETHETSLAAMRKPFPFFKIFANFFSRKYKKYSSTMCDDWRDRIAFSKPSSPQDEQKMLDFVNQHFVPLEPLNVAINMCEPGYRYDF